MELDAVGLVSALAAAVLASLRERGATAVGVMLASFVIVAIVTLGVSAERFPTPASIGAAAALVAATALVRPQWRWLSPLAAGAFAGIWAPVLASQGLPFAAACALAALPAVLGAWCSARIPSFAPAIVREEALLLVGVLGLALALGLEIAAGWKSGLALSGAPLVDAPAANGVWMAAFVAACVLLGALYSVWRRKRR